MAKRTTTSRVKRVIRHVNRQNIELREESQGARLAENMMLMRTGQRGRISATVTYRNGSRRNNQYNFSSPTSNNPSSRRTTISRRAVVYDPNRSRWDDGYDTDRIWTKNRLMRSRNRKVNIALAQSAG